jgi:hypothetical protein
MRAMTMKGIVPRLVITVTVGSLLCPSLAAAQILPPAKKAERVEIRQGPGIERADSYLTIVRWTTNNPGGSDVHYGIVNYGTDPHDLGRTAKSPIRLNQGHPETTFRVRLDRLQSGTTYYYTVTSEESNGRSDGVKSAVQQVTIP